MCNVLNIILLQYFIQQLFVFQFSAISYQTSISYTLSNILIHLSLGVCVTPPFAWPLSTKLHAMVSRLGYLSKWWKTLCQSKVSSTVICRNILISVLLNQDRHTNIILYGSRSNHVALGVVTSCIAQFVLL